jgi:DNA-binding NarL/FixJ family response regulator
MATPKNEFLRSRSAVKGCLNGNGILIISRAKHLLPSLKQYLEYVGYEDIHTTTEEKDSLMQVIRDLKPRLIFIESSFYGPVTPHMIGRLLRDMPHLSIAAFSIGEFPDDLAMYFIFYGVISYINCRDGLDEIYQALQQIRGGKPYCSPGVLRCIDQRKEKPNPVFEVTNRQREILVLLCNGYTTTEIGIDLQISIRTVETHKTYLYAVFQVRNERELIRVAGYLDLFDSHDLCFYGRNYVLPPLPDLSDII